MTVLRDHQDLGASPGGGQGAMSDGFKVLHLRGRLDANGFLLVVLDPQTATLSPPGAVVLTAGYGEVYCFIHRMWLCWGQGFRQIATAGAPRNLAWLTSRAHNHQRRGGRPAAASRTALIYVSEA